jgi:glycosyltransferase involved in cell wall biosynthesis
MGLPIITTDTPGCRETVRAGRNGILIPPRDEDALVAALEVFVHDPGRVQTMGAESRTLAIERFDVRQVNAQVLALLLPGACGAGVRG